MTFGMILVPIVWVAIKQFLRVEDRFLPSPVAVLAAVRDISPPIWLHAAYTAGRLVIGYTIGVTAGIGLALILFRSPTIYRILMPSIQSLRAVPPLATVPFFLLWFGFADGGKLLLIVMGIGLNIAVTSLSILSQLPERYGNVFTSFGIRPSSLPISFCIPKIIEDILPTLRFSLATAMGLVVVAELLGSQIGLGYLIQTSRSNFATQTIMLAVMILGLINVFADYLLRKVVINLCYWRTLTDEQP